MWVKQTWEMPPGLIQLILNIESTEMSSARVVVSQWQKKLGANWRGLCRQVMSPLLEMEQAMAPLLEINL